MRYYQIVNLFLFTSAFFIISIPSRATNDSLLWLEWLSPGLESAHEPAFSGEHNLQGESFSPTEFFGNINSAEDQRPYEGMVVEKAEEVKSWKKVKAERDGYISIGPILEEGDYQYGSAVSYIYIPTFQEVVLEVKSTAYLKLFVDHKESGSAKLKAGQETHLKKKLQLEPGKHIVEINAVLDKGDTGPWKFTCYIRPDSTSAMPVTGINDRRNMDIDLLMNGPRMRSSAPSFDGGLILLSFSETSPPEGKRTSWYEIRDRKTNATIHTIKGMKMRNIRWSPTRNELAFLEPGKKDDIIWIMEFPGGKMKKIATKDKLSAFTWAPNGKFMICSIGEEGADDKDGIKRYEHMADRWPWWRKRNFLHLLDISTGQFSRLSWGILGTNLQSISPDSKRIVFSTSEPDFKERPYSLNNLYEMDLSTMKLDTLWEGRYGFNAKYSPDGNQLLIAGSPKLFGKKGTTTPEKMIPNDYDTQLYLFDIATKKAKALSSEFKPSIEGYSWRAEDGIIVKAEEGTYKNLYRLIPETLEYSKLNTSPDVIGNWSLSQDGNWLAYTGKSISYPSQGYIYSLTNNEEQLIASPEEEIFERVDFGKVEEWNFRHKGTDIEGRVYYPPGFKEEKKYPVIVYYYGGTNPTDRSFRGRYPKNLFAAHGYLVYVLQPSGATGFGQEYSARHVNNWGKTVADEIIAGTKAFLKAHTFADKDKVGCIGASYGGFMTMLLTTRTDIFNAAIAHAGISSISSYWGEGYWGYAYSSVASANSFPWNNKELYVEQSPLFHADKVTTPLLLLHGASDTNVPRGESIQMFTALKLLGKTVEYLEIEGQNHHILDYEKRIKWQKSILAWYAKWLKDEPDWWNALYPERDL